MKVNKGQVIVYRMFDLGEEIRLKPAYEQQLALMKKERPKLKPKTFLINDPPIQLGFGTEKIQIKGVETECRVEAKFWNYGVVSIQMIIDINDKHLSEITQMGMDLENEPSVEQLAKSKVEDIFSTIKVHIEKPELWQTYEDYIIFFFSEVDGKPKDFLVPEVANMILQDREPLSETTVKDVLSRHHQYSQNDLTLINWNAALVIDSSNNKEIPDVIEFALTHLLEMRFYDEHLDEQLTIVYDKMTNGGGIFTNLFYNTSKGALRRYIEFSEFLDRVENSIKTVGDSYLAFIFRTANKEFRIESWQTSIKSKMDDLYRITSMIQGEINHIRSMILETIIVIWGLYEISLTLIPFIIKTIQGTP